MENFGLERDSIHGYFLFIDMVGLSNPRMSVKSQKKRIPILTDWITQTEVFKNTSKRDLLILPTGDGMCIAFLQGPEKPLILARHLHKKISQYNRGKIPSETIQVRIGLNGGICYVVKNILGGKTPWGPGIILAQRAMDIGKDGHILLTEEYADALLELSDDYRNIIHKIGEYEIKHNQKIVLYSAYGEGFGNFHPPKDKLVKDSKINQEIQKKSSSVLYPSISVELKILNPKQMLVMHNRTYEVENVSDKEIKDVVHGVGLDVKKTFQDLQIKVLDENQKELKISKILRDDPQTKEFCTQFDRPIKKGDKNRKYTLNYQVEEPERYFENTFEVDVEKFSLLLKYPNDFECNPMTFDINNELEEGDPQKMTKSKIQPKIEKIRDSLVAKYFRENVKKGSTVHFEW